MNKAKFFGVLGTLLATAVFTAAAQKATIDYKYKVDTNDAGNYFNWSAGSTSAKDTFDAATGASKAQSTSKFNAVRFDETGKKLAVPAGFRGLMLYPVAPAGTATGDNLTVSLEGKKVTITYIHRGTAYVITSDDKGMIDMATSFQKAEGLADNVGGKFVLKDDYLLAGEDNANMASLDWSKVKLVADTASADAGYKYTGALKAAYKDGVLTLKGNLKKVTK